MVYKLKEGEDFEPHALRMRVPRLTEMDASTIPGAALGLITGMVLENWLSFVMPFIVGKRIASK